MMSVSTGQRPVQMLQVLVVDHERDGALGRDFDCDPKWARCGGAEPDVGGEMGGLRAVRPQRSGIQLGAGADDRRVMDGGGPDRADREPWARLALGVRQMVERP